MKAKQRFFAVATVVTALSGCATTAPYTYTGKENDPKLVMTSSGMPMHVEYQISLTENKCEGFERVGLVRDDGRGVLLPWIVNMTSKFNKVPTQLESAVPAKTPVHVRSYGKWSGVVTKDIVTNGSCGPLILTFTPEESRTYQVDFGWNGTASCSSNVFDITDAGNRKSVPAERGYCP